MTQRSLRHSVLGASFMLALGCGDATQGESPRSVDPTSQPIRAAVKSNASVVLKLATALRDQTGNLFYSPISIEAVTGILYAGAAGNTAKQLGMLLDAQDDPDSLHEGLGALLADLSRQRSQYTLSLANRIWAAPGLASSQSFLDTTRNLYNAPTEHVDFAADPEAARRDINEWVSKQTADKIPELLQNGQLTRYTVMAAINAIYFKADWAKAFDVKLTRTSKFRLADSTEVDVAMMTTPKAEMRASLAGNARWIELPYRGEDISFLAYTHESQPGLNNLKPASVQELQAALAGVDFDQVEANLQRSELVVEMPRFTLRSRIDLIPVFEALGVSDLFDAARADLTNIDAGGGLSVDVFVHEAMVQVDEIGTVAAAATAAGATRISAPLPIRLDHPFLFFIRDNLTGAILFSGQVANPSLDG